MAHVPVPNGIMAEMRYTQDAQKVENVFWFLAADEVPTPTELQSVGDMLFEWWDDNIKTMQSSTVTLREIYVTAQNTADGATYTRTTGLPASGANVNEALPNSVSCCVTLRTARRGRSYRGRSFFIGLTDNNVIGNNVGVDMLTALQAAYDVLVSTAAVADHQLAICSRFSAGLPRVAGVLTPVVDAVIVDAVVDNQRRRLPGRGA